MTKIDTPFTFRPEDEGKKVYKVRQTYEMIVDQYIKANNEDEAFDIYLREGGIKYDDFNIHLTEEKYDVCETSFLDIDPLDVNVKCVGIVQRIDKDNPSDLVCEDVKIEYKDNVVPFNKTFGRHA